jgi:hypothetical protein
MPNRLGKGVVEDHQARRDPRRGTPFATVGHRMCAHRDMPLDRDSADRGKSRGDRAIQRTRRILEATNPPIATGIHGDILLMDEWNDAGDEAFVKKANERLQSLLDRAHVRVIGSHSRDLLSRLSTQASAAGCRTRGLRRFAGRRLSRLCPCGAATSSARSSDSGRQIGT